MMYAHMSMRLYGVHSVIRLRRMETKGLFCATLGLNAIFGIRRASISTFHPDIHRFQLKRSLERERELEKMLVRKNIRLAINERMQSRALWNIVHSKCYEIIGGGLHLSLAMHHIRFSIMGAPNNHLRGIMRYNRTHHDRT